MIEQWVKDIVAEVDATIKRDYTDVAWRLINQMHTDTERFEWLIEQILGAGAVPAYLEEDELSGAADETLAELFRAAVDRRLEERT